MRSALRRRPGSSDATREATIDTLLELYVTWREHAAAVTAAYDDWAVAGDTAQRALAFAVFSDILDHEALAAQRYADFLAYACHLLAASPG